MCIVLVGVSLLHKKVDCGKARERELATFDENRRAVGMLNPVRDENEGTYRGGEGMTPATTTCPEDRGGYLLLI